MSSDQKMGLLFDGWKKSLSKLEQISRFRFFGPSLLCDAVIASMAKPKIMMTAWHHANYGKIDAMTQRAVVPLWQ